MLEKFAKWLGAETAVESWSVSSEAPIFWPSWAYEFLINNPYITLHPGDVLLRSRDTGRIWKREVQQ